MLFSRAGNGRAGNHGAAVKQRLVEDAEGGRALCELRERVRNLVGEGEKPVVGILHGAPP